MSSGARHLTRFLAPLEMTQRRLRSNGHGRRWARMDTGDARAGHGTRSTPPPLCHVERSTPPPLCHVERSTPPPLCHVERSETSYKISRSARNAAAVALERTRETLGSNGHGRRQSGSRHTKHTTPLCHVERSETSYTDDYRYLAW
jgi:hypothetical protein